MNWMYKDKVVNTLPNDTFGFVYKITYTNGMFYIGKKQVVTTKTLELLKNGNRRPNSTLVQKRVKLTEEELSDRIPSDTRVSKLVPFEKVVVTPSTWKKYKGSSSNTKDLIIKKKEIIYFSSNKRTLTYLENALLYKTHAPCNNRCINENIGGTVYDNALDGWIRNPIINVKEKNE